MLHISVLADEVLEYLDVQPNKIYFDGTLGAGGHSKLILEKLQNTGHLYSWDQDSSAINQIENSNYSNWTLINDNFENINKFCRNNRIKITGGVLLDLGFSSIQMDNPARGLSFQGDGPLDMRLNPEGDLEAADIINKYREKDLANLIYKYGEEHHSRQIAQAIIKSRPLKSTKELAELIKGVYIKLSRGKTFKIHPATKTFQALRIAVNRELEVLEKFLNLDPEVFEPGARIVIISFHSLEDRIIKNQFRKLAKESHTLRILTNKPICPTENEINSNPRSRSAKLRAAMLI